MKPIAFSILLMLIGPFVGSSDCLTHAALGPGQVLESKLIVVTKRETPSLFTGNSQSGIAFTGVSSIDLLCNRLNIVSIDNFYPTRPRNPILKAEIERIYIFTLKTEEDVALASCLLPEDPNIESAEPYAICTPCFFPNDPQRTQQWHLAKTKAYDMWDYIRGDSIRSVVIGTVDTGVNWGHTDLSGNIWINPGEDINHNGIYDPDDINAVDDDSNGFIDDIHGWDFGNDDNDPNEDPMWGYHGTLVAGCISEVTDNNRLGAGIGFSAQIMATRAADSLGRLTSSYQAMIYCADNGASIINCSFGVTTFNQAYQNIINAIRNAGVIIIAAVGNTGAQDSLYPAAYDNVIAVASTDNQDHKSAFSTYGTWVDISAPGTGIYSTFANAQLELYSGTSVSSAMVCGMAAIIKAAYPGKTVDEMDSIIASSVDTIDYLNPSYRGLLGSGRINCVKWELNSHICPYTVGDVNSEGTVNGIDVVYMVNYFKGGPAPIDSCNCPTIPFPFFAAGDVNGTCSFNGIDVTHFVLYLKGYVQLLTCQYCIREN